MITAKSKKAISWAIGSIRAILHSDTCYPYKTDAEKLDAIATLIDELRRSEEGLESVGTAFEVQGDE